MQNNTQRKSPFGFFTSLGLVTQIAIGLALGILVGVLVRNTAAAGAVVEIGAILGSLFVGALKAVAPILVFALVTAAISQHRSGNPTNIRPILVLYLVGTFAAAVVAVGASFLFPSQLLLSGVEAASNEAPTGIGEVMRHLLMNLVSNPIQALADANYIGILAWALVLGTAFRQASEHTRTLINDVAEAISKVVRGVIRFAPLGIFGLVLVTIVKEGFDKLGFYLHLLAVLLGAMLFVALVVNPIIVFTQTRRNPFPLVFTCLRESGVTAWAPPSTWPVRPSPSPCSPWPRCTPWASPWISGRHCC